MARATMFALALALVALALTARAQQLSSHETHAAYLRSTMPVNELFVWGSNSHGQLGLGAAVTHASEPTRVTLPPTLDAVPLAGVCTGPAYMCVWSTAGDLYCWGSNEHGQFGGGAPSPNVWEARLAVNLAPTRHVLDVACGYHHVCARFDVPYEREVQCWGSNSHEQLGTANGTNLFLEPVSVLAGGAASTLGNSTCVQLVSTLRVVCWGDNRRGQLGYDDDMLQLGNVYPTRVSLLPRLVMGAFRGGLEHFCAYFADPGVSRGAAKCWGDNSQNQLAIVDPLAVPYTGGSMWPSEGSPADSPLGEPATALYVGARTTCFATANASFVCVGRNTYGVAGRPDDGIAETGTMRFMPALVAPGADSVTVVAATLALNTASVLFSDGRLVSYGLNAHYLLGVGSSNTSLVVGPIVTGSAQISAVATVVPLPPPATAAPPPPPPPPTAAPPVESVVTDAVAVQFDGAPLNSSDVHSPDYTLRLVARDDAREVACLSREHFSVVFVSVEEVLLADDAVQQVHAYPVGGYTLVREQLVSSDGATIHSFTFTHQFANGASFTHTNLVFEERTTGLIGATVRTVEAGTHKLSVGVANWPYVHAEGRVRIVMRLPSLHTVETTRSDNDTAATYTSSLADGTLELATSFSREALVDDELVPARVDVRLAGADYVYVTLPRFETRVEYDPDFAVLVAPGARSVAYVCRDGELVVVAVGGSASLASATWGAIIGGVVLAVVLVVVLVVLVHRRHTVFSRCYERVHERRARERSESVQQAASARFGGNAYQ